ncbi:MAG: DsbC family protein [Gammaproteobacteria bacterium]|nr:MAG: DsbC family protein [Gammaproteobacteria bacterium]
MSAGRFFVIFGLVASCLVANAFADEAAIRKNLAARLPSLAPIDEVTKTPVNGLWEVRMGTEVIYSDDQGSFVVEGNIIDLQKQLNLTQDRIAKLTAFDFAKLPLKDAVVWKQGTGARKLVVFADPNCTYCKHFEKELNSVKDITVYTFLIPILGGDSPEKSKAIWCAKDNGKVWRNWMLDGATPPVVTGACDASALDRNLALGQKHGVNGTPMLVFADSKRMAGIMSATELNQKL